MLAYLMVSILVTILGAAAVAVSWVFARRARNRRLKLEQRRAISFDLDKYLGKLDQARTLEDVDRLEDKRKGKE